MQRSNRDSAILQREDMTMRDKMLLIDELNELDRLAEKPKPGMIKPEQEMADGRRKVISDLEANADEVTPMGQCYKGRLVRFVSGDKYGEAVDWFRKSAEGGYWPAFSEINAVDLDIKWELLTIYGVRVANETRAIEYPHHGWKSYQDHYTELHEYLLVSANYPMNERRAALDAAEDLIRKLEKVGITYESGNVAKDEGLTIWADEKGKFAKALEL
ncbi:MAG: hypothetical protein ACON4H_09180 [Rubripirellula sp.]